MEYREYIPTKLNSLVLSIFERKVNIPLRVQFLPNNTISLIFYLGEKIESVNGKKINSNIFNPTDTFCFITGLHTQPIYFDMEGLHSIGLTMLPTAVKAFWGIPVEVFQDEVMDWEMFGDLAYIEDHIKQFTSFQERAIWLEDYFCKKLKQTDLSLAVKLYQMTLRLEQDVLMGKRPNVEAYSGYSKMHTHRIFKEWMGMTPGKLLRYKQFLRAIDLMHRSDKNLTQIGYECGFYDQSHFIRVFREFARMTPSQYKKKKSPLPGILPW